MSFYYLEASKENYGTSQHTTSRMQSRNTTPRLSRDYVFVFRLIRCRYFRLYSNH